MLKSHLAAAVFAAAATVFGGTSVFAGNIVDFQPSPVSSATPELQWDGSQLIVKSGAQGNGDGALAPSSQTSGGLALLTPYTVTQGAGRVNNTDGSTTFYDTTLVLTGLTAAGPADVNVTTGSVLVSTPFGNIMVPYSVTQVTQVLTSGTFQFWDTTYATSPGTATLLLEGAIDYAIISGTVGSSSGSARTIVDLTVHYTGGAIMSDNGFTSGSGQFSWSLLDVTTLPSTSGLAVDVSNNLLAFNANVNGQFTGTLVPEPATLALLGMGGLTFIRRRRAA